MSRIRHYASVIQVKFNNSLAQFLSFRVSAILTVLVDLISSLCTLCTIDFLFRNFETIGGWGRTEFMFFACFILSLEFFHSALLAANLWNFSTELRTGQLDFRLMRPIGALFEVFSVIIRPSALLMTPLPLGLLIYYGVRLEFDFISWLSLPFLFCLSLLLTFFIEICLVLGMFWTVAGEGIHFIRMETQEIKRWPDFIYRYPLRWFFCSIVPVLLVGSVPTRFLIDHSRWPDLVLLMLATVLFWYFTDFLWRCGLKRYESASS